jgi:ribosomal protein L7/L12
MPADTDSFDVSQLNHPLCVLPGDQDKIEASKGAESKPGEGKDAGEPLEQNKAIPERGPVDPDTEDQIVSLLEEGRKAIAIKLYRRQAGVGLEEAKGIIEALATKYDICPRAAGCAGMVVLMIAASTTIGVGILWILP